MSLLKIMGCFTMSDIFGVIHGIAYSREIDECFMVCDLSVVFKYFYF